jgi:hypothetical protein
MVCARSRRRPRRRVTTRVPLPLMGNAAGALVDVPSGGEGPPIKAALVKPFARAVPGNESSVESRAQAVSHITLLPLDVLRPAGKYVFLQTLGGDSLGWLTKPRC